MASLDSFQCFVRKNINEQLQARSVQHNQRKWLMRSLIEEHEKGYGGERGEGFFTIYTIFVSKIFAVLVLLQKYTMVTWFG